MGIILKDFNEKFNPDIPAKSFHFNRITINKYLRFLYKS